MDALRLLQQEHEQASVLMHRIKDDFGQTDSSARLQMFQQLRDALLLHARVEELHMYPVFQQAETTRDSARQALDDHRTIKVLLEEIDGMPPSGSQWVAKFNELHEIVTRHMKMEEEELFGHAGKVFTRQEAEELGRKVEAAKKEVRGAAPAPAGGIPD
jgi:hemerythrin superfamily protein